METKRIALSAAALILGLAGALVGNSHASAATGITLESIAGLDHGLERLLPGQMLPPNTQYSDVLGTQKRAATFWNRRSGAARSRSCPHPARSRPGSRAHRPAVTGKPINSLAGWHLHGEYLPCGPGGDRDVHPP